MPHLVEIHHYLRPAENGVRFGFCTTNQAPLAELAAAADETLFENILHNQQQVLHQCCQTERNQPTTFAQENMTVHLL